MILENAAPRGMVAELGSDLLGDRHRGGLVDPS